MALRALPMFGLMALLGLSSSSLCDSLSIRQQQLKYARVRTAAHEKDPILRELFQKKKLEYPPRALLFRAFKRDGQLELWASDSEAKGYTLVKSYGICATSGTLGPKRRFGDEQVPEGFYYLDWLNPQSNFYLSLHISYPNSADRIVGSHQNPGGDIFLHGNCVTIGCIPITDDGIKEVYWLVVLAEANGLKNVPIEIFPARLTSEGMNSLSEQYANQPSTVAFWKNLQEAYAYFERTHLPPKVRVKPDGSYTFSSP